MKAFHTFNLFICLNLYLFPVVAQTLPEILSTATYKPGVYTTFAEFLKNEPSITENFQIIPLSSGRKIAKGEGYFKLVMLDSAYARRDLKKFWGVCDGESIYVNELRFGSMFTFKELQGVGRYCYLRGSPGNYYGAIPMGGAVGGALTATAMALEPDPIYILNINNGKFYLLDKFVLKMILKNDPELLNLYELEKRKASGETMLSYINQYNVRHSDEAFTDTLIPIEIILYRRNKKEIEKAITVRAKDSLYIEMNPDSYYKFEFFGDSIELCINDQCGKIPLEKKRINYVHCFWAKNSESPSLMKVERKVGEFYFREIEFKLSKKER